MCFLSKLRAYCIKLIAFTLGTTCLALLLLYRKLIGKRLFIISLKFGNLGNRLFLSSHINCCAIESNCEVINPAFYEYSDSFPGIAQDFFIRYPPKISFFRRNKFLQEIFYSLISLTSLQAKCKFYDRYAITIDIGSTERLDLDCDDFLHLISERKVIFFRGWLFRDVTSFEKHADKMREYFTPAEKYRKIISAPIANLRKSCEIVIGLVIRHGDYRQWMGGRHFHEVDIYVKIMSRLENLFPDKKVGFFLCSDEEQDTKNFSDFNFVFRSKHDLENRYSLALCDYIVTVPSTYGSWAAFYGKVPLYFIESPDATISLDSFKVKYSSI